MCRDSVILLVEDNEDDVLLIRRALRKCAAANPLQVVRSGEEAIEYLKGEGRYSNWAEFPLPDVVLLGLKLTGLDGFEVLKWIREQAGLKRLRVVVLTCSALSQEIRLACDLGANSFLIKPADTDRLVEMIRAFLDYWIRTDTGPDISRGIRATHSIRKL